MCPRLAQPLLSITLIRCSDKSLQQWAKSCMYNHQNLNFCAVHGYRREAMGPPFCVIQYFSGKLMIFYKKLIRNYSNYLNTDEYLPFFAAQRNFLTMEDTDKHLMLRSQGARVANSRFLNKLWAFLYSHWSVATRYYRLYLHLEEAWSEIPKRVVQIWWILLKAFSIPALYEHVKDLVS